MLCIWIYIYINICLYPANIYIPLGVDKRRAPMSPKEQSSVGKEKKIKRKNLKRGGSSACKRRAPMNANAQRSVYATSACGLQLLVYEALSYP